MPVQDNETKDSISQGKVIIVDHGKVTMMQRNCYPALALSRQEQPTKPKDFL
jgi:hypothetical protein